MQQNTELKINQLLVGNEKKTALLTLHGYIDSNTSIALKDKLLSLGGEIHRFVLDFSGIEYVSSAGWGVILARIKENREKGGDIVFAKMMKNVYSIYELLELNKVIKYFADAEEGLRYFGSLPSPSVVEVQKVKATEEKIEEPPKRFTIEGAICSLVNKNPLLNSSQIKKILQGPPYAFKHLNIFKVYFTLRRMGLHTREKRLYFAWQEAKKQIKG